MFYSLSEYPPVSEYSLMGRVKECPISELLQKHSLMGRFRLPWGVLAIGAEQFRPRGSSQFR